MAEALLKHKLPNANVKSAGVFAAKNQRASQQAIDVLAQEDIMLDHQSSPVTTEILNWADVVLTMTTDHKKSLIMQFPDFQEKYFTLKEFVSEADKNVWEELKKRYADYAEKRSAFIHENQHKLDNATLNERLREHVKEDVEVIRQLEKSLINYDISDPFGGDFEIYYETMKELDTYIELLIKKMK